MNKFNSGTSLAKIVCITLGIVVLLDFFEIIYNGFYLNYSDQLFRDETSSPTNVEIIMGTFAIGIITFGAS
jgi:hypothetical protein